MGDPVNNHHQPSSGWSEDTRRFARQTNTRKGGYHQKRKPRPGVSYGAHHRSTAVTPPPYASTPHVQQNASSDSQRRAKTNSDDAEERHQTEACLRRDSPLLDGPRTARARRSDEAKVQRDGRPLPSAAQLSALSSAAASTARRPQTTATSPRRRRSAGLS